MDNKTFMGYVYAFCLGDGGVYNYRKNAFFQASNIVANEDYILWRASILETLTEVTLRRGKGSGYSANTEYIHTRTRAHPTYTKVYNRLWSTGRKGIDPHQLKFMSWSMLAILYQDDGFCMTRKDRKVFTPIASIATYNFTYPENMALKLAIKEKLDIEFNVVHKKHNGKIFWYLRLPARFYAIFRNNVEPYIFPSFYYKIPKGTNEKFL